MRTVQGKKGIPVTLPIKLKMKSLSEQRYTCSVPVYMFLFCLKMDIHCVFTHNFECTKFVINSDCVTESHTTKHDLKMQVLTLMYVCEFESKHSVLFWPFVPFYADELNKEVNWLYFQLLLFHIITSYSLLVSC